MPDNKIIYGQGREPKASEFAIGEIVINVDDKRVFSKDKRNVVFELVGQFEDAPAYRTASISSRFASASLTGVMTASFNTDFLTGSNTSIFTQELEEGDVILITSASYESYHTIVTVHSDTSASFTPLYINSDISGSEFVRTTVNLSNQLTASLDKYNLIVSGGTGIQITTGSEENSMIITATGESIAFVDAENVVGDLFTLSDGNQQGQVTFDPNSIPAGGILSANTVNLSTSDDVRFSSVRATNFVRTDRISADQITSEGATGIKLISLVTQSSGNPVITVFKDGGDQEANEVEIGTSTQTNETYLSVYGDVRVRRNIRTNRTTVGDNYGYVSASGLLFASASYDNAGNHNNVVVYDDSTGRFYITGAYGSGGGGGGDANQNAWSTASIFGTDVQIVADNITDNLIFEAGPNVYISTGSSGTIYISASGDGIGGDDGYIGNTLAGGVSHVAGSPLDMDALNIDNIGKLTFDYGGASITQSSISTLQIEETRIFLKGLVETNNPQVRHWTTNADNRPRYRMRWDSPYDGEGNHSPSSSIGLIEFSERATTAFNEDNNGTNVVYTSQSAGIEVFRTQDRRVTGDPANSNRFGTEMRFTVMPSGSTGNQTRHISDLMTILRLNPESGSYFEGDVSASGILILSASDSVPATEGGFMYSASNAFYLGFNDDMSLAGFP